MSANVTKIAGIGELSRGLFCELLRELSVISVRTDLKY
jgi:hypothetical protein